jgi:hypothetical protein
MTAHLRGYLPGFALVAAALAFSCGGSDEAGAYYSGAPGPNLDASAGIGGSTGYDAAAADTWLPPEKEVESSYRSPVATGQYVWVANPASGRVAYVDAVTLEVRTVPAGNGPTYMSAVPASDQDVAVAINVSSNDATVLRKKPDTALTARNLPVHAGANAWAVSSGGRWAIAWSDYRQEKSPDPLQAFQDLTVLDLTEGAEAATRISVGYRPVAVSFASDESQAFVVSQDGVSVLELGSSGGPAAVRLVPLSGDPLEDIGSRDVSVTPDGAYALVRRDGSHVVTVVTLADGTLTEVALPGNCTDLDLAPDGTRALAVVRDLNLVAIRPIPGIVSEPQLFEVATVEQATIGSVAVAAEAATALLYSNAVQENRITVLWYEAAPAMVQTMKLYAPVLGAWLSASGTHAIVLHQPVSGAPGAFSALSLVPTLPAKIVTSKAPITAVSLTPDGSRAVLAERNDSAKIYGSYLVRGATQQVDRHALSSPPIAVGSVLAANRAYIAQEHAEGRITFIDLDTGLARTLTGFELAARVVDGSQP